MLIALKHIKNRERGNHQQSSCDAIIAIVSWCTMFCFTMFNEKNPWWPLHAKAQGGWHLWEVPSWRWPMSHARDGSKGESLIQWLPWCCQESVKVDSISEIYLQRSPQKTVKMRFTRGLCFCDRWCRCYHVLSYCVLDISMVYPSIGHST